MRAAKILLRGASGAGKTGILNQALAECGVQPCGLRFVRSYAQGQLMGYDLHALSQGQCLDLLRLEGGQTSKPPKGFYDQHVLPLLQHEAKEEGLLLVDEVGRLERHDTMYLALLKSLWQQKNKPCLFVLKKEPLPFNEGLWQGDAHALRLDVDDMPLAMAGKLLCDALCGSHKRKGHFLRLILDAHDMTLAEAMEKMDRLARWLLRHPGQGVGIVCALEESILRTAADKGMVPLYARDYHAGLHIPLLLQHEKVGDVVVNKHSLSLTDEELERFLARTLQTG